MREPTEKRPREAAGAGGEAAAPSVVGGRSVAAVEDCRGLLCPLPVLRASRRLVGMAAGEILEVIATDPGAGEDLAALARQAGHRFLGADERGDRSHLFLQKGEGR